MKCRRIKGSCLVRGLLFMATSAIVILSSPASPALAGPYARDGVYVGGIFPLDSVEGRDLDGESYFYGPGVMMIVPEVSDGYGWGFAIGTRRSREDGGAYAIEFSYTRSTHDTDWLGAKGTAVLNAANLDFKPYFLADRRAQPYLQLGLCFPWLDVKDGAITETSVGDATYYSNILLLGGFNFGGGLAFYPHPRVALTGGFVYRLIWFTSASGHGASGELDDYQSGSGLNFNLGMSYTF